MKSAANPNADHQLIRMKKAIDDLVEASGGTNGSDALILHIVTEVDATGATRDAVRSYARDELSGVNDRLEIIWEKYDHPQ
jgi:hypothetical protein